MTPAAAALFVHAAVAADVPVPPGISADALRPDPFAQHPVHVPDATATPGATARLYGTHFRDPLVFRPADGSEPVAVVGPVWGVHGSLSWQSTRAALAVSVPAYVSVGSDLEDTRGSAIGDPAVDARWLLWSHTGRVGAAAVGRLTAPLGGDGLWLGQPGWSWELGAGRRGADLRR